MTLTHPIGISPENVASDAAGGVASLENKLKHLDNLIDSSLALYRSAPPSCRSPLLHAELMGLVRERALLQLRIERRIP